MQEPKSEIVLDLTNLVVAFLAIVVVGAVAYWIATTLWSPAARARRRMKRGTTRLVDRELVTLTGKVRPVGVALVAPLSLSSCVAHRSRARVFDRQANLLGEPVEAEHARFVIETSQGPVLVDSDRFELEAVADRVPGTGVAPGEQAFLAKHGFVLGPTSTVAFDETLIRPGDLVTVHGLAVVEHDVADVGERGYRDDLPTRLRVVAPSADKALVIARH